MTLQAPDAGELTPELIRDELLAHLRTEFGLDGVSFTELPERMLGGFETLIYGFRLSGDVPPELSGRLVVRVMAEPGGVVKARKEAAFQNAVADVGLPAPRVVYAGGDRTIGGRAFNVMERVAGHSMMEDLFADLAAGPQVADQLAQVHAQLHELPTASVGEALDAAGVPRHSVTIEGQLHSLDRYVADERLAHLAPAAAWLREHRPAERDRLSVCHGDFHPGNVMVHDGRVTGVLDWSGPQLAHAEYDIAVSLVLIAVAAPGLVEGAPPGTFEAFAAWYLEAYERYRSFDSGRIDYYRALRAFRAFARGTATRTPGVDPALMPRDQYPWANPGALRRLADVLKETTGLDLPLPPGVEAE